MDATAQHVAIMALERVLAADAGIPGEFQADFYRADRIGGRDIFDIVDLDRSRRRPRIVTRGGIAD